LEDTGGKKEIVVEICVSCAHHQSLLRRWNQERLDKERKQEVHKNEAIQRRRSWEA
jgi:Zn ribbon nucleic-acid-binding protein